MGENHMRTGPSHVLVTGLRGPRAKEKELTPTQELAAQLSKRTGYPVAHLDWHPAWAEYQATADAGPLADGLTDERLNQVRWKVVHETLDYLESPTIVEGEQLLAFPELCEDYRTYLVNPPSRTLEHAQARGALAKVRRSWHRCRRRFDPEAAERAMVLLFAAVALRPFSLGQCCGLVIVQAPLRPVFLGGLLAEAILSFEAAERLHEVDRGLRGGHLLAL
jgi:hypothetical protein